MHLSSKLICQAVKTRALLENISVEDATKIFIEKPPVTGIPIDALCFDNTESVALKETGNHSNEIQAMYSQLNAFAQTATNVEDRKKSGAVFTSLNLARHICELSSKHWQTLHRTKKIPETIGDLSCGAGAFLLSAHQVFGPTPKIFGNDVNPTYCDLSRLLLWSAGREAKITTADQLDLSGTDLFDVSGTPPSQGYDLLIGNPPYVRSPLLDVEYKTRIRNRYQSIGKGNFDLSVAFIEDSIDKLNEGGLLSYIVTSKFTHSAYGEKLCKWIAANYRVVHVEDYSDTQIFEGFTTYTICLSISKRPPAKSFLVTNFVGRGSNSVDFDEGSRTFLDTEILNGHPWRFAGGEHQRVMAKVNNPKNPRLVEVVGEPFQGLRTGLNSSFIVSKEEDIELDSIVCRPFVNGGNIKKNKITPVEQYVVFPYRTNEFGDCSVLGEYELQQSFPKTFEYLVTKRSQLSARKLDNDEFWYAFSRSQNLNKMGLRKLFVKEMMPRAEFASDYDGSFYFGAGYALNASRISLKEQRVWTAILNTPTLEFVLRSNGTQLHSGWFRLQKHHLNKVRVPQLTLNQINKIDKLLSPKKIESGQSSEDLVDQLVASSFQLTNRERDFITEYLAACHEKSIAGKKSSFSSDEQQVHSSGNSKFEPVKFEEYEKFHVDRYDLKSAVTFRGNKEQPIHSWYKYTQGFSNHLVKTLLSELGATSDSMVLDPFMGCGTTLLTCKEYSIPSVGFDVSPFMKWVCDVKTENYELAKIDAAIQSISKTRLSTDFIDEDKYRIFQSFFDKAYHRPILSQVFSLFESIDTLGAQKREKDFLRLGVLGVLEEISKIRKHGSHYRFLDNENSVGLMNLNIPILGDSADIFPIVLERLHQMKEDIERHGQITKKGLVRANCGDARTLPKIGENSISHVITSPPYLNRNNYISQQKAELSLLSLVRTKEEYKRLVQGTFSSHVEANLPKTPKSSFPEINKILDNIVLEPGNNAKIPHMIAGYFEDLFKTFESLHRVVMPQGRVAFVVGNTRWGGVVVPVDHILAKFAERIGFSVEQIMVTRLKGNSPQQMKKYGKIDVRESIVVLKK